MVIAIAQQLWRFGDQRSGYDAAYPGKRQKNFDVWHSLSVIASAEFVQYFLDATSHR
jgi:hypothetical protein